MQPKVKPIIKSQVPVFGEGTIERSIIEKIAPVFNRVGRSIEMLNQRLARLEAIGPGVQINYAPKSIEELKQAIDIIAPKVEEGLPDEEEWAEEETNDSASENAEKK